MTWSEVPKKLDRNLVLVTLLSVFAIAPLTYPGFFQSHSGFLPVFNLFDLELSLRGSWGWAPAVGVGYDLLRGEGPLPYLLAELLRWLGLGGVDAIKTVYAVGFLACGLGTYLLGKEFFGARAGLVAAVVYVYLPYHLATVYVRGAFGEAWAFVLYPLILLCLEKYLRGGGRWWASGVVLLEAALALTNLGLAMLYALILLGYALLLGTSRRIRGQSVVLLLAGVGLGLLLQVPATLRNGISVGMGGDFFEHFVYPFQLLSASWGYGASVPGWEDTLPLQLGLVATGLTLFAAMLLPTAKDVRPALRKRAAFLMVAALAMVFLLLHAACFLWRASLLSTMLRYPWQLLALIGLAMSLASGSVVGMARGLAHLPWQAVLVTLAILASYGYLSPRLTDVQIGGSPVAVLGDEMALLTYQREGPLLHGATVRLTFHWQCLQPMDRDYAVFVHIVDSQGTIWGQRDATPADGERPTSSWGLGEIVEDQHEVTIDVEGPREGYTIEVGAYLRGTGERLPVSRGGTAVILD